MPWGSDIRATSRALLVTLLALAACGPAVDVTFDDAAISARVRTALLNDPQVGSFPLAVDTRAGVVTLTGDVRSDAQVSHAVAVARTVAGVVEVTSRLRIVPPPGRRPEAYPDQRVTK